MRVIDGELWDHENMVTRQVNPDQCLNLDFSTKLFLRHTSNSFNLNKGNHNHDHNNRIDSYDF